LLYEGSAEQSKADTKVPFSFSYKQENEQNPNYDRTEQGWSPNGLIRGNDDQLAPLERKGTVVEEIQDYQNKMDFS
jgi:hypothetical protein